MRLWIISPDKRIDPERSAACDEAAAAAAAAAAGQTEQPRESCEHGEDAACRVRVRMRACACVDSHTNRCRPERAPALYGIPNRMIRSESLISSLYGTLGMPKQQLFLDPLISVKTVAEH